MAESKKLELEEDHEFHRSEWRAQRAGWVLWAGIVLAGMIGLLGTGPLSSAESSAADGSLTVAYDRFLHNLQPTKLELNIASQENTGPLRIHVSQRLLDSVQILRIEPEPDRRELVADGVAYTFLRAGTAASTKVQFHVEYQRFGNHRGRIALDGHDPATVSQFVYP